MDGDVEGLPPGTEDSPVGVGGEVLDLDVDPEALQVEPEDLRPDGT